MLFTSKKKIFFSGLLAWTCWILFYIVIFKIQTSETWGASIISSATSNYTFALLSIGIWHICRKIPFGKVPFILLAFIHFILANIFSALWIVIVYGSWYLQVGDEMLQVIPLREIIGWQFMFGIILYLLNAGVFYTIIYYRQFKEKELGEKELKILSREAQLNALKMQMNPHFLFNSLNSVNALIKDRPDQAREMMAKLSDLLRFSLDTKEKSLITLKEELDIMHKYLEIEEVRFTDRLKILETIEPGLESVKVPALLLQPLVENSVRHGLTARRGEGWIKINISSHDGNLLITISNLVKQGNFVKHGSGTSLENIRQRLSLLFQENSKLSIIDSESGIFTIKLIIPIL